MYFLLLLAFVGLYAPAKAALVNIPDANFRARLQTLYPACFVGAQMETTCVGITSALGLSIESLNIINLSGVEYFTSLQYLSCYYNQIATLPTLPSSLTYLDCGYNQFVNPPSLPANLQTFYCYNNQLTSLATLPSTLRYINCSNNRLTALPLLPSSLINLECYSNNITNLSTLPTSLTNLDCSYNNLTNLPIIPTGLQSLGFRSNLIANMPILPSGLKNLYCSFNPLTVLPALPPTLIILNCIGNQLTSLPVLPVSLTNLRCDQNLLDFADLEAINPKPATYTANQQYYFILPAIRTLGIGNALTINGTIGGSLNVYKWYKNNVLIPSAVSASYNVPSVTNIDSGVYRCEVTSNYIGLGTTTGVTITSSNVTVNVCGTIAITNTNLSNGTINTLYTQTLAQTGLFGTPIWSVSVGSLPLGLALSATTGLISGTLTTLSTSNFTIQITDGVCTQTKVFSIIICPVITITPLSLLNGTINLAYNSTLTQTGLTGIPVWSVSAGNLPNGLSLASTTGIISGTPTTGGTSNFTIEVSNGTQCSQIKNFSIIIVCPTILFNNTVATNATTGIPYTLNPNITGNTGALTCTISPSLVGSGLNFNTSTGVISGTPTGTVFSTAYTITAAQGICSQSRSYTFGISCPVISFVNTTTMPSFIGNPYSLNVSVTGNTQPITYTVDLTLPPGLSLNPTTGIISGTPTAIIPSALYTITAIQGVGAGSCGNLRTYLIAVSCPNIIFMTTTATNGIVGTPYTLNAGATGTASLTYSVNPTLPAGLSLNPITGIVSGTPTTAKLSTTYVVTATQSGICGNSSPTQSYAFAITENLATSIDNSLSNLVKISPNPSNGDFVVDFSGLNVAKSLVRVYDTQGKQVLSSENNANLTTISLGNMPNGIYLLEIETAKGRILKRLAKN